MTTNAKVSPMWTKIAAIASFAVAALGLVLPWLTASAFGYSQSINAFEEPFTATGIVTILAAIAGIALFGVGLGMKNNAMLMKIACIVGIVAGALALIMAIVALAQPEVSASLGLSYVSLGFGFFATLIGAIAAIVFSVLALVLKSKK